MPISPIGHPMPLLLAPCPRYEGPIITAYKGDGNHSYMGDLLYNGLLITLYLI